MTPEEKAQELIEKYKDYVHGYVGSSMLSNTEYPEQIESQARKCAIIAVDEILKSMPLAPSDEDVEITEAFRQATDFWTNVKKELEK